MFSLDLEGHLAEANEALQGLTGRSRDEMLAIDYHQLVHPEDIAAAEKAFSAVKERVPPTLEARLLPAVGEVCGNKMAAVPVVVFGQVIGVHALIQDVTEANALRRDLEAADTATTLYLANVGHEVRTPLTMSIGAAEILLDTEDGLPDGHADTPRA